MKFTLNNRPEEIDRESLTVEEMLQIKKFSFRMRIVRINDRLIKREAYSETAIKEGDNVQMLYLMSGG